MGAFSHQLLIDRVDRAFDLLRRTIMFLFLLIILSTVSCGFAEKTLPDSDIILAEELHSEDPSSNHEDEDKSSVNVEEILRELSAERKKNRDLNQTISDILDKIANLEDFVIRNEEKITENQRKVLLVELDVEENTNRLETISTKGRWCGFSNGGWHADNVVISYDKLSFSDTNMDISRTPLDMTTGIFTAPLAGTYTVSFSLFSNVNGHNWEHNKVYLHYNGVRMTETMHETHSGSDDNTGVYVISTSGREVFIQAQTGDTISLNTERVDSIYGFYSILTCF